MTGSEPAFPANDTLHPTTGERFQPIVTCLTIRQYFAAMAMQGILANPEFLRLQIKGTKSDLQEMAVKSADYLIEQLNK